VTISLPIIRKRNFHHNRGKRTALNKISPPVFVIRSLHIIHSRTHMLVTPYMCGTCNKACTSARNLTLHLRTHTGEKPFKCPECDKTFTQQSALTQHMRIHTGEKPYQCHVCAKAFAHFGALVTHVRVHTGIQPFKCDCGKAYKARSGLSYHKRSNNH
jgi:uncharacterized Zn-finger protein